MSDISRRKAGAGRPGPKRLFPTRNRRVTRVSLEPLETRQLLAYTFTLAGATATVVGDTASDTLVIDSAGGLLEYSVNGSAFSTDFNANGGAPATLAAAAGSTVNINPGGGTDSVTLGTIASPLSTLGAAFAVSGVAAGGSASLTLEDGSGPVATATIGIGSATGLSASPITYGAGVTALNINAPNAGNTLTVSGTPAGATTTINTGTGTSTVGIRADSGPLAIVNPAGVGTFTVGNGGRLDGIAQPVTFSNSGGISGVIVDDTGATTSVGGTITATGANTATLTGLSSGAINYSTLNTNLVINETLFGNVQIVDFANGNPIPGANFSYNGGGFSNLVLSGTLPGGPVGSETSNALAPTRGNILVDGSIIRYSQATPIVDITPQVNYTFNYTGGLDGRIRVAAGPIFGSVPTTAISSFAQSGQFPTQQYANKANVFINAGAGNDLVAVVGADLGPGTNTTIDGQGGTNALNYDAGGSTSPIVITPTGGPGNEATITRAGSGSLLVRNFQQINVVNGQVQGLPIVAPSFLTLPALSGFAGSELVNVDVATFLASTLDPAAPITAFGATITWGDGTAPTAGTIVQDASNPTVYHVQGSHIYQAPSPATGYTVTVAVGQRQTSTTTLPGVTVTQIAAATGTTTAAIRDLPISVAGGTVRGVAGTSLVNQVVGTLTPTNPFDLPPGFPTAGSTVSINWGDSTTSAGSIVQDGNHFNIVGTHTYGLFGPFTVTSTISGLNLGPNSPTTLTVVGSAIVIDAVLANSSASGPITGLVEGAPFTGTVARFTDPNALATAANFTATIAWGDGHVTAGVVSADPSVAGQFLVTGTNTYALPGNYSAVVTIANVAGPGGSSLTIPVGVTVGTATVTTPPPRTISATVGVPFSGLVGGFISANPLAVPSEFSVSINWGDNSTPTAGTILQDATGGFEVFGTHTYLTPFTGTPGVPGLPITYLIREGNNPLITVGNALAVVADAAITAQGATLTAVAGRPLTATVATFTYDAGATPTSNFTGSINWGDGTTTTIAPGDFVPFGSTSADRTYGVNGTHTYRTYGTFAVTTTINSNGGSVGLAQGSAIVADAPIQGASTTGPLVFTAGVPFSGPITSFTSGNPFAPPSNFVATINWGDGTITQGFVEGDPNIIGSHTYARAGNYSVVVTVADVVAPGGNSTTIFIPAVVNAAALVNAGPPVLAIAQDYAPFTGVVGNFLSANPGASAADFVASINFGDGTPASPGVITKGADGVFSITGAHTFAAPTPVGTRLPLTVTVRDQASSVTTTLAGQSIVFDAPLTTQGATVNAVEGSPLIQGLIATFTYAGIAVPPGNFGGTVDWGDGTTSTLSGANFATVQSASNLTTYLVNAAHTYTSQGTFPITATLISAGGSSAVAHASATVADSLTVNVRPFPSTQLQAFSNVVVATFADAGLPESVAKYAATINWGDGTPVVPGAIVSNANGTFNVLGSHTYAAPGAFLVGVTVTNNLNGITTGYATTQVAPEPIVVAGQLNPASDAGASRTDAITNVNRPNFFGNATPGATVLLYALPVGTNSPILAGRTIADASGAWNITSVLLADGRYIVEAVGIDPAGVTSALALILPNALQGYLTIDTVAPKVANLQYEPQSGRVLATFQDNATGLDQGSVINGSNYAFTTVGPLPGQSSRGRNARLAPSYVITGVTTSPQLSPTATQTVTLTIDNGRPIPGGFYRITIRSGGIEDVAGNALDGTFYGYLPSGNNRPGGDFVANLSSVHNTILPPLPVGTSVSPLNPPGTRPVATRIPTVRPTRGRALSPLNQVLALPGQVFPVAARSATTGPVSAANVPATRVKAPSQHQAATRPVIDPAKLHAHDAALLHLAKPPAAKHKR